MQVPRTFTDVVCPFCSLACDDLEVAGDGAALELVGPDCALARVGFARPATTLVPSIDGVPATLDAAIARAAMLLRGSALPLFAGLGTDVGGMRAVLELAERTGGIVDHGASRGLIANLRAQQDGGWVAGTLAEVRNRADLVLFVGTDGGALAPRLVERCLAPRATLFGPLRRHLVYLGQNLRPAEGSGAEITTLPGPAERLPEIVAVLRALAAGAKVAATEVAGLAVAELRALADRLAAARYAVIVWAAGAFAGRQPDLLTGTLAGLTRELNAKGRCAALPLAAPDNVIGTNQVCAWQTGLPLRTSFASGGPDHDPVRWSTAALVEAGGVDRLFWLGSIGEQPVPATTVPTVALHGPGLRPERAVAVAIPVGTPGLDHAGSIHRQDGVVSLPLRPLRDLGLPSAALVLRRIAAELALPEERP